MGGDDSKECKTFSKNETQETFLLSSPAASASHHPLPKLTYPSILAFYFLHFFLPISDNNPSFYFHQTHCGGEIFYVRIKPHMHAYYNYFVKLACGEREIHFQFPNVHKFIQSSFFEEPFEFVPSRTSFQLLKNYEKPATYPCLLSSS